MKLWDSIKTWWKRPYVYIEEVTKEDGTTYRVYYYDHWDLIAYRLSSVNNTLEAAHRDFDLRLRNATEYQRIKKLKTKKRIIKAG